METTSQANPQQASPQSATDQGQDQVRPFPAHDRSDDRRPFGSIRMLPSGRFQARYRPRSGPHFTAPDTFDTEEHAQAWLNGLKDSINRLESTSDLEALASKINAKRKA